MEVGKLQQRLPFLLPLLQPFLGLLLPLQLFFLLLSLQYRLLLLLPKTCCAEFCSIPFVVFRAFLKKLRANEAKLSRF